MKTAQTLAMTDEGEVDPLIGVKAKTGWYPTARNGGWSGGRKRILGPKALEANYYHVMSRTCGGEVFFDDEEKEALRLVIWRVAEFCGVQVLTYCVMGNHFHVLTAVPHRENWMARFEGPEGEKRLLAHLRSLYSRAYIEQLQAEMAEWRRLGMESMVQKKLESFKQRLCDLSRFVKEVKERFSRWYNKRHGRRGTLWMDRYRSVLIEGLKSGRQKTEDSEGSRVDVVRTMAAYIDLNPVRAELVKDAADYPWCGYGEAVGCKRKAQRGLCRVLEKPVDGWEACGVAKVYAGLLAGEDQRSKKPKAEKKARQKTEQGGEDEASTPVREMVRSRVPLFSEAVVLGSKTFVEEVFAANRTKFGPKRKAGAKRVRECAESLYSVQRVRKRGR